MKVLQFKLPGESPVSRTEQDEELGTRSIRLPRYVWDALDKDAHRCRRSPVKQLEMLLARYYNLDANHEIDEEALNNTAAAVSPQLRRKKASR